MLVKLPPELIGRIYEQLYWDDGFNLRLAPKALRNASLRALIKCHFAKRYHKVSRDSLQTLIHVSKQKPFAPKVEFVCMSSERAVLSIYESFQKRIRACQDIKVKQRANFCLRFTKIFYEISES